MPSVRLPAIVAGHAGDEEHAEEVGEEVHRADVRARVLESRSEVHARVDRHDLDHAVNAAKKGRLEVREPEAGDDDRLLVRETVRNVVERGEEREEPRLRISESFIEPAASEEVKKNSSNETHCSILKCLFSTPVWFSYGY